ncbi:MAG: hypothetical protein ACP5JP_10595, partial [bacterium]
MFKKLIIFMSLILTVAVIHELPLYAEINAQMNALNHGRVKSPFPPFRGCPTIAFYIPPLTGGMKGRVIDSLNINNFHP